MLTHWDVERSGTYGVCLQNYLLMSAVYSNPRWGSLAENHSPETHGFRPMTKGEEPIQLYINIYMISSAPCFQPFSHFYLIS